MNDIARSSPLTWLLVNQASGSNDPERVAALEEALAAAGHPTARVVSIPDDELPTSAELDAAGVGMLAIFTGDGTVNAAVGALAGWQGRVVVLPGGTQNLFAKACHGELSELEIVERLGAGDLVELRPSLIRTAHGDALCEVLAGPGAHWSDVREAMRNLDIGEMASTMSTAIEQSASGPQVAVVDPERGKPEGYPAVRIHLGEGASGSCLVIDGYGAESLGDYAMQGLALLKRDFREGPHDELGGAQAVTCRSSEPIELMIDGERATGSVEERFAVEQCEVVFLGAAGHRPQS
jgi:hypothetical protein